MLEQSVEDYKAFGRSFDEFDAHVLQTEKEGYDVERVKRRTMMERGSEGWRGWHQHLGAILRPSRPLSIS
jgi:hypothetical protein